MKTEQKQLLSVGLIMLAILLGALWAVQFAQKKGGGIQDGQKSFRAKEGTMRKNAQVLTSKKKKSNKSKSASSSKSNGDKNKIRSIKSLTNPPSENERIAKEALNTLIPEEGIKSLLERLATLEAMDEAADLYSALGLLHAQTDPPDIAKARAAFSAATDLAQTDIERHHLAYMEVSMLVNHAKTSDALKLIRGTLEFDETISTPRLQLLTMWGNLMQEAGELEVAETTFRSIAGQSPATLEALGPEAIDVYRQACLRLTRLYRKTGRDIEADELTRTMKQRLSTLE